MAQYPWKRLGTPSDYISRRTFWQRKEVPAVAFLLMMAQILNVWTAVPLLPFAGVFVAHFALWQGTTFHDTHLRLAIRTFWFHLAFGLGVFLVFKGLGLFSPEAAHGFARAAIPAVLTWYYARLLRGGYALWKEEPIAKPQSLWF